MRALVILALLGAVTANKLRVCYYSNWSQYRNGAGKYFPTDIPADLCTHLMYSFAKLDNNYELAMFEWNDDKHYAEFNALKQQNPGLRTLLAIGGWNMGSATFSPMAADPVRRRNFAKKSVEFLRYWGFDGLDLDWEYPTFRTGGKPEDKDNFIYLIDDLLAEYEAEATARGVPRLMVTAAVAAGKSTIDDAYHVRAMGERLDFIGLMAYDLNGAWNKYTGHNAPLYSLPDEVAPKNELNVHFAAEYWVDLGVPREKLIIGLATYGRGFKLADANVNGMGAQAVGACPAGPYTGEAGYLAYYEICALLENGATRHWDDKQKVPYLTSGTTWIGYDDEESITLKLQYIRDNGFGGAMVWNIDLDDFKKTCRSSTEAYPLMSLMEPILGGYNPPPRPTTPSTAAPPTTTLAPGEYSCTGKNDGYYPDLADCNKYYQCWSGTVYPGACPSGQVWNSDNGYCDHTYNFKCKSGTTAAPTTAAPTTAAPTTAAPTTAAPTTAAPTTAAPTTAAPTTAAPTTAAPTTAAPTTAAPTTAAPTTAAPTTGSPPTYDPAYCVGKADGFYINPTDCGAYYQCYHYGRTVIHHCAAGTLFNVNIPNCDWESNVDCGGGADDDGDGDDGDDDDDDGDDNNDDGLTDFCASQADGRYPFPADCSQFFNCGSGITYIQSCPPGTLWDTNMGNCNHAWATDCGDRPR